MGNGSDDSGKVLRIAERVATPVLVALLLTLVVVPLVIGDIGVTDQRTVWDYFDLITIPLAVLAATFIFSRAERRSERRIATERNREEALQRYLDAISALILEQNLMNSTEGYPVREVAQVRTLTTLRGLDPERKVTIIRFLIDSRLLGWHRSVVSLEGAELGGVDLRGLHLEASDFRGANLRGANLAGAFLERANLMDADLTFANLDGAALVDTRLTGANLFGASGVGDEQLAQAEDLTEATMPDGSPMTEEVWQALKARYPEESSQ